MKHLPATRMNFIIVHFFRVRLFIALVLVCTCALTACSQEVTQRVAKVTPDKDMVSVGVAGIHHLGRGHHIGEFSIDGRSCGNAGSPEKNSGSDAMCFVPLPREWQYGLKYKVRWGVTNFTDDLKDLQKGKSGQWHEAVAELERYGEPQDIEVHFYKNGVVRLVPNSYGPPDEDTSPDQTPPLAENPVAAPSWYWMGQTLAKQKHEKLTADDQFRLDRAQKNSILYFAFLERLWRSRGLSDAQVKAKLDKERQKEAGELLSGHARYLANLLEKKGYTSEQIKDIRKGWPDWTIEETDALIRQYTSPSGAKK